MSSNYQQKKMMNALGAIDTKGNIVLEQFQDGTALLFQPGNAEPFCVATDYDRATASWSYGKYFSDLGCAHEAADPEIIEDASVRWVKEDIREKLKAQDIAPTEFNVQSVIMGDSRLWERPLDRDFRDNMIASGNDDLDARVAILKENGNFKNVDTAMPVESLDDEIEIPEGYRIISGEKWASDLSGIGREWVDDINPFLLLADKTGELMICDILSKRTVPVVAVRSDFAERFDRLADEDGMIGDKFWTYACIAEARGRNMTFDFRGAVSRVFELKGRVEKSDSPGRDDGKLTVKGEIARAGADKLAEEAKKKGELLLDG